MQCVSVSICVCLYIYIYTYYVPITYTYIYLIYFTYWTYILQVRRKIRGPQCQLVVNCLGGGPVTTIFFGHNLHQFRESTFRDLGPAAAYGQLMPFVEFEQVLVNSGKVTPNGRLCGEFPCSWIFTTEKSISMEDGRHRSLLFLYKHVTAAFGYAFMDPFPLTGF